MTTIKNNRTKNAGINSGVLIIILLVVSVIAFVIYIWQSSLETRVNNLKEAIEYIKSEYVFAQIEVIDNTDVNIQFELTLFNVNGDIASKKLFDLPGNDVFLESKVVLVEFEDTTKAFVYPYKIYTDAIPEKDGNFILDLYVMDNELKIYSGEGVPEAVIISGNNIFNLVFNDETGYNDIKDNFIIKIFDTSVHQGFSGQLQSGEIYKILIHPNGGIELMEAENG